MMVNIVTFYTSNEMMSSTLAKVPTVEPITVSDVTVALTTGALIHNRNVHWQS